MIYFDNAATSFPKAPGVADAISRFVTHSAANPGRAGHRMSVAAERMLDDVRLRLTRLIGGEDHHRLVFALNTTDALNIAIKGVLLPAVLAGKKPHAITTVLEHNSVSRPLQAMAQAGRIELTRVDCSDEGVVDPQDIRKAIKPHTRLIAMTHASNVLGTIQDAAAIGRIAREHDVLFCLDAAQTAGALPIDIKAMHVDLLAFPGHKSLLGPTGIAGLYVGPRCKLEEIEPWREGGTGGDSSTPTQPAVFPHYLEAGTPNTIGIAGLGASLDFLAKHPIGHHLSHERAMVQRIIETLADKPQVQVFGPKDLSQRVGVVSIRVEGFEPSDLGTILDDSFNIAVRPGLHCAPYIHRRLGTHPSGLLRISPGPFNTQEQLEQLLDALTQVVG